MLIPVSFVWNTQHVCYLLWTLQNQLKKLICRTSTDIFRVMYITGPSVAFQDVQSPRKDHLFLTQFYICKCVNQQSCWPADILADLILADTMATLNSEGGQKKHSFPPIYVLTQKADLRLFETICSLIINIYSLIIP